MDRTRVTRDFYPLAPADQARNGYPVPGRRYDRTTRALDRLGELGGSRTTTQVRRAESRPWCTHERSPERRRPRRPDVRDGRAPSRPPRLPHRAAIPSLPAMSARAVDRLRTSTGTPRSGLRFAEGAMPMSRRRRRHRRGCRRTGLAPDAITPKVEAPGTSFIRRRSTRSSQSPGMAAARSATTSSQKTSARTIPSTSSHRLAGRGGAAASSSA